MSAITGIFHRNGKSVNKTTIQDMNNTLAHRGPDGSGTWCDGPVAFGHQMLHTTPESLQEVLPFEDKTTELIITADARIDNREELSEPLGLENQEDVADSQFILKSYEKWGDDCPEKLLGDFAFVIWDKNNEKLFCARDHMGVKPFYYHLSDTKFLFATEMNVLLSNCEIPTEINELMIGYFLSSTMEDRSVTFYNNLYRLPAAHKLILDKDNDEFSQYWSLNPQIELKLDSTQEYVQAFKEIFTQAVQCRLRCNYPVGTELSGGLDSSSITSLGQILLNEEGKKIRTFSLVFDDFPESDERMYIREILEKYDVESSFIKADKISPLYHMDEIIQDIMQPLLSYGWHNFDELYAEAKKHGVHVVLSGFEGDAVVSYGYDILVELFRSRRLFDLLKEFNLLAHTQNNEQKRIFWNLILYLIPQRIKKLRKTPSNDQFFELIDNDFIESINLIKLLNDLKRKTSELKSNYRLDHYQDLNSGIYQSILEEADFMAGRNGVEIRYPFFDRRLLEFCLALPVNQIMKKGWDRAILRFAMQDILPSKIQRRIDKKYQASSFEHNLISMEKDQLDNLLIKNSLIDGYVDNNALKNSYHDYKNYGIKSNSYSLFRIILLKLWLETVYKKLFKT